MNQEEKENYYEEEIYYGTSYCNVEIQTGD